MKLVEEHCSTVAKKKREARALALSRAELCLKRQDASGAISLLEPVLEEDADHLGALEIQARALWVLQDLPQVLLVTQHLLRLNPFETGYHGLRGMAFRGLGLYGEAAEELALDPQSADALAELESFQAELVGDLLHTDLVFAATYAQNPDQALRERGFKLSRMGRAVVMAPEKLVTHRAFARPS